MGFGSDMDDSDDKSPTIWVTTWRALRPAAPAVIGGAALTFLFAAVMPMAWVAGISWNLYLDRLSDLFLQPIGNGARLALALGMATIAALIAGIVALLVAQPEAAGLGSLRRRSRVMADDMESEALPRRRADFHPDDPPRPPIRAGRDLPAEGLGPTVPIVDGEDEELDLSFATVAEYEEDELVLADLAPEEAVATGDEPWLQPAEFAGPAMPDPADRSLGAMVQRFEAGLNRRRHEQAVIAATPVPAGPGADSEGDPEVDFALEAALGTLQRLNRQSVS